MFPLARHRPGGPRSRTSAIAATLGAAALLLLGIQTPAAQAAPAAAGAVLASPAKSAPATGRTSTEPVCSDPGPGRFSCFAMRRSDVTPVRRLVAGDTPEGVGPADIQDAYNLPADGGSGRTVAIVDAFDDPTAEADLAVYRAQYGLPPCTTANGCFRKVSQRGGTDYPRPDADWSTETSLDLDMVSAAAPNAHILLVVADSDAFADVGAGVDQAVAMGAQYVSNSYGAPENEAGTAPLEAFFDHPGVAMVAATGDDGYGVSFPASSQHVTAVGGTTLVRDASTARGWSEHAWDGAGSGCSGYQPKPAFQTDPGCEHRTVADVSAVADPLTGPAIYQTYGGSGWNVVGGTSAATPVIAGVYAAAGAPTSGTDPVAYPYLDDGSGLNDITGGSNGSCSAAYLCSGVQGYDGPSGLGTPDGLAAFRDRAHGEISGTVTDAAKGTPVAGASVAAGPRTAYTDAEGAYKLVLPTGSYDLRANAFGHQAGDAPGTVVTEGTAVTRDFALTAVATRTVSGKVTDGSGHGWPLYAKITVEGVPAGPVWTDPVTGAYSVALPKGTYTLRVTSDYPGYQPATRTVTVAKAAVTANVPMTVDTQNLTAPGYVTKLTGPTESFGSATSAPAGWTVTHAEGTSTGWEFDDPGNRSNLTGGEGAFAMVDSDHLGSGLAQDTSLVSPVYDLTGQTSPALAFRTDYHGSYGQEASVDVTTDGGTTWRSVWNSPPQPADVPGPGKVEVPLTQYAGQPALQVRFHFSGGYTWWWEIDDVFVGNHGTEVVPGGLTAGTVTDANTGKGIPGAELTGARGDSVTTTATPDDPALADGFYWFFSKSGKQQLSASRPRYTAASKSVTVTGDSTVKAAFKLKAGRLEVTPGQVQASVGWGGQAGKTLTVRNTGGAAATLKLKESAGHSAIAVAEGAPLSRVRASGWLLSSKQAPEQTGAAAPAAAGDAWESAPDLPVPVQDNAVDSYHGTLYSSFGYNGSADTNKLYGYDPKAGAWAQLASASDTREAPAHGVIDGKLYAVGGWGADTRPDSKLEVYDPAANSWTTGAASPAPYAGSGSAVLDGKLYVVGGCGAATCGTDQVSVYDPAADSWAFAAQYPEPTAWTSCAGIQGKLYCAGGATDDGEMKSAYVYDAAADSWSALPDMPKALFGSAYTSANGLLLISGGQSGNFATNEGFAYDPAAGTWTALPNADQPSVRGGGAAGFYKVGGALTNGNPLATVELLPGYDQLDGAGVSWLSESTQQVTVQPGASAQITLALDASVPEVGQPGTYTAELQFSNDSPYQVDAVPVSLTVAPPASWGKITGTVRGTTASGGTVPLAGATVEVDSWVAQTTLTTDKAGGYALWLDKRNNPLTVIVAKDGYKPTVATVKVVKGAVVLTDFTLKKA